MATNGIGTNRRRFGMALGAMAACTMLASCASFVGPRDVDIPLYRLQAGLDRHFPLDNRALELFDIQLSRPELAILPERDRVGLTMQAKVAPFFLRQAWHGSLALSGRLYLDPSRNAVFMTEPSVDRLAIDGVDDMNQRQLTKVANLMIDQVVSDVPLYSFHLEDLSYAGVKFVPTSIRTVHGALRVHLEPVK